MSFSSQLSSRCSAPCAASCPEPVACAWSQPCVTSCGDSRAVVYPPPVVITFPGPILSSCPQESVVGSSAPSGNFLGSGNLVGSAWGTERPMGLQGSAVYGGFFSSSSSSRNAWSRRSGGCGPC